MIQTHFVQFYRRGTIITESLLRFPKHHDLIEREPTRDFVPFSDHIPERTEAPREFRPCWIALAYFTKLIVLTLDAHALKTVVLALVVVELRDREYAPTRARTGLDRLDHHALDRLDHLARTPFFRVNHASVSGFWRSPKIPTRVNTRAEYHSSLNPRFHGWV